MCIFCSIISREIPSIPVYEDEKYIVINDIKPQARIDILLIPKKHIEAIFALEDSDRDLMGGLLLLARDIGKKMNFPGYRLQFNVGEACGQEVPHIHVHLLVD